MQESKSLLLSELQLEFRFPQEEEEDGNNIEKQPVLPSASFSPPSVADQAATPDPGGMSMYHGSFPNLSSKFFFFVMRTFLFLLSAKSA